MSPLQTTQFWRDIVSPYHERKGSLTYFSILVRFVPMNNLAVMDDWSVRCVYGVLFH